MHCPERVELLEYVSEEWRQELYAGARAVVVPSVWLEMFDLVTLEAMAHSNPVIGRDRGDIAEMVDDGVTGSLYPVTDVAALADCIDRLATDREEAVELDRQGRVRAAEEYTYDAFETAVEAELHIVVG